MIADIEVESGLAFHRASATAHEMHRLVLWRQMSLWPRLLWSPIHRVPHLGAAQPNDVDDDDDVSHVMWSRDRSPIIERQLFLFPVRVRRHGYQYKSAQFHGQRGQVVSDGWRGLRGRCRVLPATLVASRVARHFLRFSIDQASTYRLPVTETHHEYRLRLSSPSNNYRLLIIRPHRSTMYVLLQIE